MHNYTTITGILLYRSSHYMFIRQITDVFCCADCVPCFAVTSSVTSTGVVAGTSAAWVIAAVSRLTIPAPISGLTVAIAEGTDAEPPPPPPDTDTDPSPGSPDLTDNICLTFANPETTAAAAAANPKGTLKGPATGGAVNDANAPVADI